MKLPPDYSQRIELNDELHARPPEPLEAPLRISYVALLLDPSRRADEWRHLCALATRFNAMPPPETANHFRADLGAFRLRWERHTEFSRYMFIVEALGPDAFPETALDKVPADWVSGLPGEVMVAAHAALVKAQDAQLDIDAVSGLYFAGNVPVGSSIGGGAAIALTDFRIHPDGFSRLLIEDHGLAPWQAGRTVQRLLEIETYTTMALLAFPVARSLAPFLARSERELAEITTALMRASAADESVMLDRLTQLEAEIESRGAENHFRFSAAAAYYALVQRRIEELRETRIQGLQTFAEFIARRLAPAISTCLAAATRQETLSGRVARATQLLSTRVDVTQARQNQELLQSMNRRAQLQLRLQETVEGLSVAAVTYYIVGLVGYLAKGLEPFGLGIRPDLAMAASIPIVVLLTALGVRRIRKSVTRA